MLQLPYTYQKYYVKKTLHRYIKNEINYYIFISYSLRHHAYFAYLRRLRYAYMCTHTYTEVHWGYNDTTMGRDLLEEVR